MTQSRINDEYFTWLIDSVCNRVKRQKYSMLLEQLYGTFYEYFKPMDGNRYSDGIDLRYRYGRKHGLSDPIIASMLDTRPCSILEMMVALCIRCENQIMEDDSLGDRTGQWFWNMIASLGLSEATNDGYNADSVRDILRNFMDYRYCSDGSGGLFTVEDRHDMLEMDIWYQMMAYLNTIM